MSGDVEASAAGVRSVPSVHCRSCVDETWRLLPTGAHWTCRARFLCPDWRQWTVNPRMRVKVFMANTLLFCFCIFKNNVSVISHDKLKALCFLTHFTQTFLASRATDYCCYSSEGSIGCSRDSQTVWRDTDFDSMVLKPNSAWPSSSSSCKPHVPGCKKNHGLLSPRDSSESELGWEQRHLGEAWRGGHYNPP